MSQLQPRVDWPYPSLIIVGSRRLTGANLYAPLPGAVLEVETSAAALDALLPRWQAIVTDLLERVGWEGAQVVVRRHHAGAGLFISAPIDGLLAATELTEQSWLVAESMQLAKAGPGGAAVADLADIAARLRVAILHDRSPRLTALADAARDHGVGVTFDDDEAAVGSGTGVRVWPLAHIPPAASIDWATVHDVPIVLVTGSNGKTTTTRLIAAMLSASGAVAGVSCTDGITIGGESMASGDYAGPGGARRVLHDPRVTAAVLETARGGILRRGLAVDRARVAVVTGIAADHFGEYGIGDLDTLGRTKLVVASVVEPGGCTVLNADDPTLTALAPSLAGTIVWFAPDSSNAIVRDHVAAGGAAATVDDGVVCWLHGARREPVVEVLNVAIALGGAAGYNVANALAATAAAASSGVPIPVIGETLRRFGTRPSDNPGRLALLEWNGARIVVDFVHNPDGWRALGAALSAVPAKRRIIVLGQAGDRDDDALREIARAAWALTPDLIVLKEMSHYRRGRAVGETTTILRDALQELGAGAGSLSMVESEMLAIERALSLSAPGDLLVLAVHEDFPAALQRLQELGATPRHSL